MKAPVVVKVGSSSISGVNAGQIVHLDRSERLVVHEEVIGRIDGIESH